MKSILIKSNLLAASHEEDSVMLEGTCFFFGSFFGIFLVFIFFLVACNQFKKKIQAVFLSQSVTAKYAYLTSNT